MLNGFKLYKDLTIFFCKREDYKVANIHFVLSFAREMIKKRDAFTQEEIQEIFLEPYQKDEIELKNVSNSYRPKIILNNSKLSNMDNQIMVTKTGTGNNIEKLLTELETLNDRTFTMIFFTKKRIVGINYGTEKNRFTPYIAFDPYCNNYQNNEIKLYDFQSRTLVLKYLKSIMDQNVARFCLIARKGKKEMSAKEKVKKELKIPDILDESNEQEELVPPKHLGSEQNEEIVTPTGFTKFIDQFISGEKKVEPSDRILIKHEKEIKFLKNELKEEKKYSIKLFKVIQQIQKNLDDIELDKIDQVSNKLKGDVDEIKKLAKFKDFEELSLCVVCMERRKNTLLLPCKHLCLCKECVKHVVSKFSRCPICQQKIDSYIDDVRYV